MKLPFSLRINGNPMVLLLMPLLVGCAVKTAEIDMNLASLLEGMERKAYVIRQFRAEFIKTRISGAFNRGVRVNGTLVLQKPRRFRLCLKGDVNVDVLSDGEYIRLTHDNQDQETFRLRGDRDLSRFTDPLMIIINGIGDGALRRFTVADRVRQDDEIVLEIVPGDESYFQRIERVFLSLSVLGELRKIKILFKDGDVDETVFESWSMLAENDPEILDLDARLKSISEISDPGA
jgi:hypothetical protein